MHSQINLQRYASQKEAQKDHHPLMGRALSLSLPLGRLRQSSVAPEEDSNSSAAMRKLKKINDCKDTLRGRLSVLQIQEQKHEYKAVSHQQKFVFLQQKRDEAERHRQAKAQLVRARQKELQEVQERAKKERLTRKENLGNARKQLRRGREEDFKEVKERRGEIERSISQSKKEEAEAKRQRQQEVKQYERTQRTSVSKYREAKLLQVRQGEVQAAQGFSRVRLEQAREVEQLAKLEMLMVHKQASSRQTSQQSELKLKQLLNSGRKLTKANSTTSTIKLPSISPPKKPKSEQNMVIV